MTRAVVTCTPDDTISHVSKVMTKRRIRHLPVVDDGRLAGIVSIGDVVRHRLDELELETNVLRDYAVSRH
jgi:CBS domain-containing protein